MEKVPRDYAISDIQSTRSSVSVVSELSSIYGNETRLILDDGELKLEKADMQNFYSLAYTSATRAMCSYKLY